MDYLNLFNTYNKEIRTVETDKFEVYEISKEYGSNSYDFHVANTENNTVFTLTLEAANFELAHKAYCEFVAKELNSEIKEIGTKQSFLFSFFDEMGKERKIKVKDLTFASAAKQFEKFVMEYFSGYADEEDRFNAFLKSNGVSA